MTAGAALCDHGTIVGACFDCWSMSEPDTLPLLCDHGRPPETCGQCVPEPAAREPIGDDPEPEADSLPFVTRSLAAVQPEPVRWLWERRLAAGTLSTCDGDPGVGKSTLALTIAAHVTKGRAWPDGAPAPRIGNVLLLSGEDSLSATVRPRLDRAGADPARVFALDAVRLWHEGVALLRDPHLGDVSQIESAIRRHSVSLLIVDVWSAFLPHGTDSHRDQDVRAVLRRLRDVAEATGTAVLLLRHLNKSGGGSPLYRGSGSIGIVGAARTGMLVARDPEDPETCVIASTKSNLGPAAPALAYTIEDRDGIGAIRWGGVVDRQASDLLASPDDRGDSEERDALAAFLTDYLTEHGGIASAADVTKAVAGAFGPVAKVTLKRARDRAGVHSRKAGMRSGWLWSLEPEGE